MFRTPEGHPFIRLHYLSDETMTEDRIAELRRRYTSQTWFEKEMEIRADALSGQRIYPEFDPEIHVIADSLVPRRLCRFMSIDPHPRTPDAMLWLGIDQWDDWWIYREIWPSVVYGESRAAKDSDRENSFTIKEYAESIALAEGNYLEFHHEGTAQEYAVYRRNSKGENIIFRLMDQAGKGFQARGQLEQTVAERYALYGIPCVDPKKSHKTGEDAIHELLKPRLVQPVVREAYGLKGFEWPRLHIAASCKELILELRNHRYQKTRTFNEERELKQEEIEARRHLCDNLRYLATSEAFFDPRLAS